METVPFSGSFQRQSKRTDRSVGYPAICFSKFKVNLGDHGLPTEDDNTTHTTIHQQFEQLTCGVTLTYRCIDKHISS